MTSLTDTARAINSLIQNGNFSASMEEAEHLGSLMADLEIEAEHVATELAALRPWASAGKKLMQKKAYVFHKGLRSNPFHCCYFCLRWADTPEEIDHKENCEALPLLAQLEVTPDA